MALRYDTMGILIGLGMITYDMCAYEVLAGAHFEDLGISDLHATPTTLAPLSTLSDKFKHLITRPACGPCLARGLEQGMPPVRAFHAAVYSALKRRFVAPSVTLIDGFEHAR